MNNLGDLNELLFKQIRRLDNEELKGVDLEEEVKRGKAIEGISTRIIENANTVLKAEKMKDDMWNADAKLPKMLGGENE